MDSFLSSLDSEIAMSAEIGRETEFDTIFFGGGTPSLLKPDQLERIFERLYATYRITPDAEITVETNPGTTNKTKLVAYRKLGVNRLSIGIQSFHDDDLRFLTRIHSSVQAEECVRQAQEVGFENISIDLIFSLPHQTLERWQSNIRRAVALGTQHISAYSLIVEPNTPLARMVAAKQVTPLPEDEDADLYEWTMKALSDAGFEHYEVSNYACKGFRSRHNRSYWNHSNYIGFGPSAHSFWSEPPISPATIVTGPQWKARRWWNIANLNSYIDKIQNGLLPIAGSEQLTEEQLSEEIIMLGLRSDGLNLTLMKSLFGLDVLSDPLFRIENLILEGLAVLKENKLTLTDRGYQLCDEISQNIAQDVIRKFEREATFAS